MISKDIPLADKQNIFTVVYRENHDRIFRLCCAYCPDADDRDDLMQNIFINVWRNLDSFQGRSQIGTWIYRIAVNTALLFVKRRDRWAGRFISSDMADVQTSQPSPDAELVGNEEARMLYACINRLAELDRLVITMVLDDLTYDDISQVTGLSPGNVGVRISRIKKKLAAMMKGDRHE